MPCTSNALVDAFYLSRNPLMHSWQKYSVALGASLPQQYYDLCLKSTRLVLHCWPYAGYFTPVDNSGENYIEGWQVDTVRVSVTQ